MYEVLNVLFIIAFWEFSKRVVHVLGTKEWRCPNCDVNVTVNQGSAHMLDKWTKEHVNDCKGRYKK